MFTLLKYTPLFAAVLLAGCTGGGRGAHPTTPVEVTVMYQGKAVEDAAITFVNTDHESPVMAVGRTDAQGVAKMRTYSDADGAVKGTHRVSILKTAAGESREDLADIDSEEYDPNVAETPAPKPLIPQKYGNAAVSGLSVTVGDTPVQHTFELTD